MQFYILDQHPVGAHETCASIPRGRNQGPPDCCPVCGEVISMLKWLPPYRADIELRGKAFGDLAFGTHGADMLVSELFADLWRHHRLKGLSGFEPVEVLRIKSRNRNHPSPPKYFRASIGRGPAALDCQASGIEWNEPPTCMECRAAIIVRWTRVAIEAGTWTEEDIFEPRRLPGTWVVSSRFKDLCEDYQITNAKFVPAEEYGYES